MMSCRVAKRGKWAELRRKKRTGVDLRCVLFFWDFSVITLSLWINPAKRGKWAELRRKKRTGVDLRCVLFFWDFSVITLSLWINPASLL